MGAITREVYLSIHEREGGRCAVCGGLNKRRRLSVDNRQATRDRRGLLCRQCHSILCSLHFDLKTVQQFARYLTPKEPDSAKTI